MIEKESIDKLIQTETQSIEQQKKFLRDGIEKADQSIKQIKEKVKVLEEKIEADKKNIDDITKKIPAQIPIVDQNDSQKFNNLVNQIRVYDSVVEKNKVYVEQNKKIEKEKADDQKLLKEYRLQRDKIVSEIDDLKKGKIIFQKDFPNYVISTMVNGIEDGINKAVGYIYNGRYKVKMKESRSGIETVYGPRETSIAIASGFEKELFTLGYKNAFGQIAGLGVLFLDEVDSFASVDNSRKVFETIGELHNKYKQVFIITHKEPVQEMLRNEYRATCFVVNNGVIQKGY
jgi:DNA repair exonuclease SbcCD ATPase subunit